MPKEEESAVDGKLDVGVAVVIHECVAHGTQIGVPCAFGECSRGERERVRKVVAEPSSGCCTVCVPRGSHRGRSLVNHRSLVVWGGVQRGRGGGGSGLGGLSALLVEHVEQGCAAVRVLCAGGRRLVRGGGGGRPCCGLGARELGPVHLPTSVAWG